MTEREAARPPRPYRLVRRIVVGVIGATLLVVGVAMLVLPGPAVVVIPAGLAVLAVEFEWARRALRRAKRELGIEADDQPKTAGSRSTPTGQ